MIENVSSNTQGISVSNLEVPPSTILTPPSPPSPPASVTAIPKEQTVKSRGKLLADFEKALAMKYKFAKDVSGGLYVWVGGVYVEAGDFIARYVKGGLWHIKLEHRWDKGMAGDLVASILTDCPRLPEVPELGRVNVKNGMLNLRTLELEPHLPTDLSYVQLPVEWNPVASTNEWESFIHRVFEGDSYQLAEEVVGWLVRPDMRIQKAVCLLGSGANGKSTYLNGIKHLLGDRNISAVPLHTLQSNKFASFGLIGKLANICPDLSGLELAASDTFKQLTGNDGIWAEKKFGESFHFTPFARLVFSTNNPPSSKDAGWAYYRRWLIIPFNQSFEPGSDGYKTNEDIRKELYSKESLEGLLRLAIRGLQRLEERGHFKEPDSVKETKTSFMSSTDPLTKWWVESGFEWVEGEDREGIEKGRLYVSYSEWRKKNKLSPMMDSIFFRELKELAKANKKEIKEFKKGGRTEVKQKLILGIREITNFHFNFSEAS
jgi:P4 family phage/plasmid primase-like protien